MTEKHDRSNSDKRFGDMLNRVARLRLFRNSNREFGDYIGYRLNSTTALKIYSCLPRVAPLPHDCIVWFHCPKKSLKFEHKKTWDFTFIIRY